MEIKTHRIRRSADGTVEGLVIEGIQNAKFLSLVGRPANQRAFSVIRSEQEGTAVSTTGNTGKRITRTRRSDTSNVAALTFPVTYTDEQVTEALASYSMTGFTVERSDESVIARRDDLQSIADDKLTNIKLTEDGIIATVVRSEDSAATAGKTQLGMTSIVFSSETFSRADAKSWLEENQVDFTDEALDNSSGNFVLLRKDAEGDEEVRQIELAEGVVANIVRSDAQDIPEGFVLVVNEAAWCGWGWGALDFDSKLANIEVGEKIREGLRLLEDLLRDILFYSNLPIASRKELAQRSLSQFGDYAGNLLDQLPRQLLLQVGVQRKDKAQEPVTMTDKPNTDKPNTDPNESITLTRADLDKQIADAVAASKEPAAAPAVTDAPAASDAPVALTRADITSALADALTPLASRLDKLEGTTVVRSDTPDPANPAAVAAAADANLSPEARELKRQDVFGTIDIFGTGKR